MKIGIDASRAVHQHKTGTERYAFELITHLIPKALDRRHQLILYTNQPAGTPSPFRQDSAIEYKPLPFPRVWTHIRLAAELRHNRPDLFFTPAHVIPLTYFGPSLATIHDLGFRHYPETHPLFQRLNLEWSTRHNAMRSKAIIADSNATKEDLRHHYQINPNKIKVIYPGISHEFLDAAKAGSASDHQEAPYLLFLSTLHPRKNVGRIIEAFARIAESIPHNLILAGKKGWLTASLTNQIEQLPAAISQRIKLPGFVTDEEKIPLIKGADLFLYPSLHEGFGFPLLEANACGTPVIAANNSSLAELGANGAAWLINGEQTQDLAQGILFLLKNEEKRAALVKAGYKNLDRFLWGRAAEEVLDLMESVV